MTEIFLRIEELTKKFGSFTALSDISLDVFEGEFVCFLGPSGCGKTTLLRAIAGLDIQTQGRIEQDGQDISVLPPAQRDFGIVFQSYALFPNLTVEKNVAYGLESRRNRRAETRKRVQELLALVDLADQSKKYPAQLSGGQQQRVALARALATAPGLLLLDEPLSALDAKVRAHLRLEIKELQRRLKVTTIMVTHDQEEAMTLGDVLVVMKDGLIHQIGPPSEIYDRPADRFVASFVGTPPMNLIEGEVRNGAFAASSGGLLRPPVGTADGPAVLGIRPEAILVSHDGGVPATVVSTERLGDRMDVVFEVNGTLMTARCEPTELSEGQSVAVTIDVAHVFDAGDCGVRRKKGD